ncbi:MAG: homocysteine biosynthesis protein, partial [Actinomycetia bacterium]|nr:homocysteine biosynthesis protein [Actinomycetes bacterium]
IPVIDEEMVEFLKVKDEDIQVEIFDYSVQRRNKPSYGKVDYKQLRSGKIKINNKSVQTGPISSYARALEIADLLKERVSSGKFYLTDKVQALPLDGEYRSLEILSQEEL